MGQVVPTFGDSGERRGLLFRQGPRPGDHARGFGRGNRQHAVVVADHQIAAGDDHPAHRHRHGDLARPVLVRPRMRHPAREHGEAPLADLRQVADRAVEHHAREAGAFRVARHDVAHQGVVERAAAVDDEHVAGAADRESAVDRQVVTRAYALSPLCRPAANRRGWGRIPPVPLFRAMSSLSSETARPRTESTRPGAWAAAGFRCQPGEISVVLLGPVAGKDGRRRVGHCPRKRVSALCHRARRRRHNGGCRRNRAWSIRVAVVRTSSAAGISRPP